jgi:hypothetical protein
MVRREKTTASLPVNLARREKITASLPVDLARRGKITASLPVDLARRGKSTALLHTKLALRESFCAHPEKSRALPSDVREYGKNRIAFACIFLFLKQFHFKIVNI